MTCSTGPPAAGHAEEVDRAADLGGEVEVAAVRRPARRPGIEIPVGGEVPHRTESGGLEVDVARATVGHLLVDDHLGADRPYVAHPPAVGREAGVRVVHACIGQPGHPAVERHPVEFRRAVGTLLAGRAGIERELQRRAVGHPVEAGDPGQAEGGQGTGLSASRWVNGHFGDRSILPVRQREALAVLPEGIPVERVSLESFLVALREVRQCRSGGWRPRLHLHPCQPAAIGTSQASRCGRRCGFESGGDAGIRRVPTPGGIRDREDQAVAVVPSRIGDGATRVRHLCRWGGAAGRGDPSLRGIAVGGLHGLRHGVDHPPPVGRNARGTDRLDPVVVLGDEGARGPGLLGRGRTRRREPTSQEESHRWGAQPGCHSRRCHGVLLLHGPAVPFHLSRVFPQLALDPVAVGERRSEVMGGAHWGTIFRSSSRKCWTRIKRPSCSASVRRHMRKRWSSRATS